MQNNSAQSKFNFQKILPWGLFLASVLPLILLAIMGFFTRYMADDYSTSASLVVNGFWKAQSSWYMGWSGRYSYFFLISLVELAGLRIVPWLPIASLLIWASSTYWSMRQLFRALEIQVDQVWVAILANLVVFSTIKGFKDYVQVVFWQSGIITYEISILFISVAIGIFIKRVYLSGPKPLKIWEYGAWMLAFLFFGGFSETWVIMQISITGLAFIAFAIWDKSALHKNILSLLALTFFVSWIALILIAKSPGNMNRDTVMAELSFNLLRASMVNTFLDLPRFLLEWLSQNTSMALMLFLGGFTIGSGQLSLKKATNFFWLGLGLFVGAYILMWASFVPQYTVMSIRPPERVLFMSMDIFLWEFALFGVFTGSSLNSFLSFQKYKPVHWILVSLLALALLWLPVRSAYSYFNLVPSLHRYAQLWDQRDQVLRKAHAQGKKDVVVDSLRRNPDLHPIQASFWIEGDLQDASSYWVNQMASSYYRLASISLHK